MSVVPSLPHRVRAVVVGILTAAMALLGFMAISLDQAPSAAASHYRATQLTWKKTGTNKVQFHVLISQRCTYYYSDSDCSGTGLVGQTLSDTIPVEHGDGTDTSPSYTIDAVDPSNDVLTLEAFFDHTYAGPGPYTASISDCCRLSASGGHINNPDGSIRVESLVDLSKGTGSPVATVAPVVDCPINADCSFTVPASDPDGDAVSYRFATAEEASGSSGGFVQPPGATISASGVYHWNTTGATLTAQPDTPTYYSTQVIVKDMKGGAEVSHTAVDFFIRLVSGSTNHAPEFESPTPADGEVILGYVGQQMTFSVNAHDDDAADTVTTNVIGKPSGSTYTPTNGNPATGVFTWTPTALGDYPVTLTATDNHGLGAVPRGITLRIGTPPTTSTTAVPTSTTSSSTSSSTSPTTSTSTSTAPTTTSTSITSTSTTSSTSTTTGTSTSTTGTTSTTSSGSEPPSSTSSTGPPVVTDFAGSTPGGGRNLLAMLVASAALLLAALAAAWRFLKE